MLYSDPITKKEAASMYTKCMSGVTPVMVERITDRLCSQLSDVDFLKDFNRLMNLRLRMFAPGMYQIVYDL
ncbi:MAG: hypothetical protein WC401_10240 [Bacteroidales bacterium]|jgi:hypothetical protein